MWPQITVISLWAVGFAISLIKHGEYTNAKFNFFVKLITIGFAYWVLDSGGFFNNIK